MRRGKLGPVWAEGRLVAGPWLEPSDEGTCVAVLDRRRAVDTQGKSLLHSLRPGESQIKLQQHWHLLCIQDNTGTVTVTSYDTGGWAQGVCMPSDWSALEGKAHPIQPQVEL